MSELLGAALSGLTRRVQASALFEDGARKLVNTLLGGFELVQRMLRWV